MTDTDKLREALAFYGNMQNWQDGGFIRAARNTMRLIMSTAMKDRGERARAALAAAPQPAPEQSELDALRKVNSELIRENARLIAAQQPTPADREALISAISSTGTVFWNGATKLADALLARGLRLSTPEMEPPTLDEKETPMTEEPWNRHIPGDPMPCKCGDSVVEVKFRGGTIAADPANYLAWGKDKYRPDYEITEWRFVERKGEDVIRRCAECDCAGGEDECNWIKPGPNPGSPEAVAKGCTCPILDNAHGGGYLGIPGMFVMTAGCPLHAPTHTDMMVSPGGLDDWLTENPLPEETP